MAKRKLKEMTEEDQLAVDAIDPVLKMLDDPNVSIEQIFETFGWELVPEELLYPDRKN